MTISRKTLGAVYALIGLVAFVGTWGNILGTVTQYGFWEGTIRSDGTPSSTSPAGSSRSTSSSA